MSEIEQANVLARLEKIERESRTLKRFITLVLVVLGSVFVMGQAQSRQRTLEAEKLIIRYPNGKEAIVLGTYPSLHLLDKDGNRIPALAPSAEFINQSGVVGAAITADPTGGEFHVNSTTLQVGIITGSQQPWGTGETASFSILRTAKNQSSESMFEINADSTGTVTQWMIPNGADGAQLRLTSGPEGAAVQLWDNPKLLRAVLGKASLEIPRTGSVESLPLSSLVLFDKEGKLIWRAP
jgi:hypothetical protein